jgi:hypothetical protein
MVAYNTGSKNLQNNAAPERIVTTAAERGLFRMLGVAPVAPDGRFAMTIGPASRSSAPDSGSGIMPAIRC